MDYYILLKIEVDYGSSTIEFWINLHELIFGDGHFSD